MAKELPYFQFEPAEYLTKDISFCSLSAQGLFINLCSFYWQRECKLTKDQFLRRFKNEPEFIELIEEGVIELDDSGNINIKFLIKQYENATDKSKINSVNGSKGGRPRKAKLKRIESEIKPNQNRIESESKGIREEKIKEDNIKVDEKSVIGEVKPSHLSSFLNWLEYRKQIKKPIKVVKTLELLVKDFNKHSVNCCEWVTNHSISNGYQGLFWDKYTEQKTKTGKHTFNSPIL